MDFPHTLASPLRPPLFDGLQFTQIVSVQPWRAAQGRIQRADVGQRRAGVGVAQVLRDADQIDAGILQLPRIGAAQIVRPVSVCHRTKSDTRERSSLPVA